METILVKFLIAFFALILTAVSSYIMQYLRAKLTDSELDRLIKFIKIAVKCAEQIYTPEEWKRKKTYVLEQVEGFLNDRIKIKLTAEQINLLIEGVVNEVKKGEA